MNYSELKTRHRQMREQQETSLGIRIHRALSWLDKAEQETDEDAKFIFLWICFNSAYASEFNGKTTERSTFRKFIQKIVSLDSHHHLHHLFFKAYSGPVRLLISNKFVFEPFWKAMREHDSSERWKQQFQQSTAMATRAIINKRTDIVLEVVFDRLYVLRNQLLHGGATWKSSINRQQVKDSTHLMEQMVPVILSLMIDEHELEMGNLMYPIVA